MQWYRLPRLGLLAAAVAATLSATLDWETFQSSQGHGFGYFGYLDGPTVLIWRNLRPPGALLLIMVEAAWALFLLARWRPALASLLALPTAVVLAVPLSWGSSLPALALSREITSEIRIEPGPGLWCALVSAAIAAVLTAQALLRSLLRRRSAKHRAG